MRKNEDEVSALVKEKLYTPVVGDILDIMGYSHQSLPVTTQPPRDDTEAAGKACIIPECDVYQVQKRPSGLLTEASNQPEKNEVYIATGAYSGAMWEEILIAIARTCGAVGAVLDGYTRDAPQALEQDSPVFATGHWAQDSSIHTDVIDFRCIIEIGDVIIHDGDLVSGDMDDVLIIPKGAAIRYVGDVLKKAVGEKQVRRAVENGTSAIEALHKFSIL